MILKGEPCRCGVKKKNLFQPFSFSLYTIKEKKKSVLLSNINLYDFTKVVYQEKVMQWQI